MVKIKVRFAFSSFGFSFIEGRVRLGLGLWSVVKVMARGEVDVSHGSRSWSRLGAM